MNALYEKIQQLCLSRSTNVTAMCRETNIPRSALSELAAGRTKMLSTENAAKIAQYFGISVEALLGLAEAPAAPPVTDGDLKVALFGGAGEVSDEMWEEVRQFAEFVREREKNKNNG